MTELQPLVSLGAAAAEQAVSGSNKDSNKEEQKQRDKDELEDTWTAFRCFKWFTQSSTPFSSKLEFVGWIIMGILVPVFYGVYINMADEGTSLNWGYILCAVLSLLLGAYATMNFSGILELKKAVEKLLTETTRLAELRGQIQAEIGNLKLVVDTLAQIEEEQSVNNQRLRNQEKQFREWSAVTFEQSSNNQQDAQRLQQEYQSLILKRERDIERAERNLLLNAMHAFERYEDDQVGLNRAEYDLFVTSLPQRYRNMFAGKSFEEYSNGDDVIDHDEFKQVLNDMVSKELELLAKGYGIDLPGLKDGVEEEQKEEPVEEPQAGDS